MLRKTLALAVLTLGIGAFGAAADSMSDHKTSTITGEVVDTGCYLGHGAHGAKHIGCATKCIKNGMPMGLLTSQGTVYLLTLNHDDPDPYRKLQNMAGKTVAVTGAVMDRGGMKGIEVTQFKPAPGHAAS